MWVLNFARFFILHAIFWFRTLSNVLEKAHLVPSKWLSMMFGIRELPLI